MRMSPSHCPIACPACPLSNHPRALPSPGQTKGMLEYNYVDGLDEKPLKVRYGTTARSQYVPLGVSPGSRMTRPSRHTPRHAPPYPAPPPPPHDPPLPSTRLCSTALRAHCRGGRRWWRTRCVCVCVRGHACSDCMSACCEYMPSGWHDGSRRVGWVPRAKRMSQELATDSFVEVCTQWAVGIAS